MKLQNVKVTRDDAAWEAEIKAEIPAEMLAHYRVEALKEIRKTAKLDGFRPGKAPEEQILQVYGEGAILREA
ncbi:trigger factor family protein, partial [Candidatus Kaiserbacteria bacterium]|nr:trigger factor family protein [Candidatus Kaiserbacteria bacterium]